MEIAQKSISIIIPVLNEAENIKGLLAYLSEKRAGGYGKQDTGCMCAGVQAGVGPPHASPVHTGASSGWVTQPGGR